MFDKQELRGYVSNRTNGKKTHLNRHLSATANARIDLRQSRTTKSIDSIRRKTSPISTLKRISASLENLRIHGGVPHDVPWTYLDDAAIRRLRHR